MDAGIAIGISAGSVVLTLAALYVFGKLSPFKPLYSQGPSTGSIFDISLLNWFNVLYYFLPYGLFLFGVIYDGLIRKIKFFPAGFIGLGAVYLNSMASKLAGLNTIDTDICGIPGMGGWGSDIAPQSIVFVSAVLSYIATYVSVKPSGSDPMSYVSAWIGVAVVWALQAVMFNLSGCLVPGRWVGGSNIIAMFVVPFMGLIIGGTIGSLSGGLIAQYVDGGSGISSDQKQSLTSSGPAMGSTSATPGAGKCSATDSDDQFVCEAYKNGELVTSTIVE